jgi:carbon-monoxide dehydrogenase large subunit
LREHTVYDDDGQLLTGSYMDYALPRGDDAPLFLNASHPVPTRSGPRAVARQAAPARCHRS